MGEDDAGGATVTRGPNGTTTSRLVYLSPEISRRIDKDPVVVVAAGKG
jgi:hypothetical protein